MTEPCPIVAEVRARLLARAELGMAKYGTNLARTDLSEADWLNHLRDELLDAACYATVLLGRARAGSEAQGHQGSAETPDAACEAVGRLEMDVSIIGPAAGEAEAYRRGFAEARERAATLLTRPPYLTPAQEAGYIRGVTDLRVAICAMEPGQ